MPPVSAYTIEEGCECTFSFASGWLERRLHDTDVLIIQFDFDRLWIHHGDVLRAD